VKALTKTLHQVSDWMTTTVCHRLQTWTVIWCKGIKNVIIERMMIVICCRLHRPWGIRVWLCYRSISLHLRTWDHAYVHV